MKTINTIFLCALLIFNLFFSNSVNSAKYNGAASFKVIELFTSEGCSSCPPADELIQNISKEYEGSEVYILAYHVDYWNKLGWKDPFSSAAYSARQYGYGEHFKLSSIYTPQIVVNGNTQFVGSDELKLRSELRKETRVAATAGLELGEILIDKNSLKVSFSVTNAIANNEVRISLVQKQATSNVKRGENIGRNLTHVQLVRDQQFVTVDAAIKMVLLTLPPEFNAKQFELIGFIQDPSSRKIVAATRKKI